MLSISRYFAAAIAAAALSIAADSNDAALIAKAKAIHDRVLKLDTHNDIAPTNFTADCNYTMRLSTQVNLPIALSRRSSVTSTSSWSPGTTGRLKRALSMPT